METLEILQRNELFKHLTPDELTLLAQSTITRKVPKNTLVINQGDTSNSLFIIKEGHVNVTLYNDDGKELILATLRPGDHFGELALLDEKPRSANVITIENSVFIVLHKEDFFRLLESNPRVALSVIRYLCNQIRLLTSIAESLALMDVYGRLVKLLMDMAEVDEHGEWVIDMPLTHKDIAKRVGSSREMISRIMKELEKGHYLTTEHKTIKIHKKLPIAW